MIRLYISTIPRIVDINVLTISVTTGSALVRNERIIGLIVNTTAKIKDAKRRGIAVQTIEPALNLLDLSNRKIKSNVRSASRTAIYTDKNVLNRDTSDPARTSRDNTPSSTS